MSGTEERTQIASNGLVGAGPENSTRSKAPMAGSHPEIRLSASFAFLFFPFLRKLLGRLAQQPAHRSILFLGNPFQFCQGLLVDPNCQPFHVISSYDILHCTSN